MRPSVQIILDGRIVSEQKNLRAISDYGSRIAVRSVVVAHIVGDGIDFGGVLHVLWRNGATCTTGFASIAVCKTYAKRLAKKHGALYQEGSTVGDQLKPTP